MKPSKNGKLGTLVLGVDPGLKGAFVVTNGSNFVKTILMPVVIYGKDRMVTFGGDQGVDKALRRICGEFDIAHVFLERAVSFNMGTKAAFNYGRGFEALCISITLAKLPFTLIEPHKWAKLMHQGADQNMKPKFRSQEVVKRLYPSLISALPADPVNKRLLHDGAVDALLIAGYGLRTTRLETSEDEVGDFF